MDKLLEKLDKVVIFFVVYTIIFMIFFKTLGYTLPFVLAFIFAFILQRPTKFLARKLKIKNSLSSIITTILFFAIIISALSWGIASLTSELIQLGKNTQVYISNNTAVINQYIDIIKQYYKNLDATTLKTIQDNLSTSISKVSNLTVTLTGKVVGGLISFLASIPNMIMIILFTLLSTYFFTRDMTSAKNKILHILPAGNTGKLSYIISETKKMLGGYIASYALIVSITFLETLLGFLIFGVKYALLLSLLSALFDILPIVGTATVYIPIAIIYGLSGDWFRCVGILIWYAVVFIIRQIVEPKIVSSNLGMHPVAILAAIFIGLKMGGLTGMIFCVFLVVFYTIFTKVKLI